ncbi:hypothetical protein Hanom_Chr02g00165651 [Helianthus anomalus]
MNTRRSLKPCDQGHTHIRSRFTPCPIKIAQSTKKHGLGQGVAFRLPPSWWL